MATANVARRHGDDCQARLFWLKAASLLDPQSPIISVAYERGPKGFDDIRVEFDPDRARRDHEGKPIYKEHIQCKWHTTAGSFGYEDLINPDFINANRFSLLQRAHDAQKNHALDGLGCQFKLLTNWRLTKDDPLQDLVRKESDSIDLEGLFDGTTDKSRMGKVRKLWREHLELDDKVLALVARVLAIAETPESLASLRERLDEKLAFVGLKRIPINESAFLYDDLIVKLHAQGRVQFDRKTFRQIAEQEGILNFEKDEDQNRPCIGIRSFMHPIDSLEERCGSLLDLVPYFDGRYIRCDADWQNKIIPELTAFLTIHARRSDNLRLMVDAHVSIAFAVGSILNVKSGKSVEIEQRTNGRQYWSRDDTPVDNSWAKVTFDEENLGSAGEDIAVSIALTHDIGTAVSSFVRKSQLPVKKILYCKPETGPSQRVLASGAHAFLIAETVAQKLYTTIQGRSDRNRVHIFIAGPNGFAFFLGQHQKTIGPCSIYEWDFEGQRGGGYSLGISLP